MTQRSENKNKELSLTSEYFTINDNVLTIDVKALNSAGVLENCRYAFANLQITEISNLHELDTSHVKSMFRMFYGCSLLKSLDLSNFDTSNVDIMMGMFSNCMSLKYLNISTFNTFNVTLMDFMFHKCSSLTSLNLSNFDTSKCY